VDPGRVVLVDCLTLWLSNLLLARRFRDLAGATHQRLAAAADEVYAAIMGMVLRIHPVPVVSYRHGESP
jgi:adenosyl cobinamide kinase/adenosyl cobinamide phosphate guanylyltransferase